jgi:hypothetical protein
VVVVGRLEVTRVKLSKQVSTPIPQRHSLWAALRACQMLCVKRLQDKQRGWDAKVVTLIRHPVRLVSTRLRADYELLD